MTPQLCLFDGPYCVQDGVTCRIPEGSRRLVGLVVLGGGWLDRRAAAGTLWPAGSDARAVANLRSALWRLRGAGVTVLDGDAGAIWLRPGTTVDLRLAMRWADRLIDGVEGPADLDIRHRPPVAPRLLPGLADDWVERERELVRHHLVHGWEALVHRLIAVGRPGEAAEAAGVLVDVAPLRASARRGLRAAWDATRAGRRPISV
ncbi:AfsR/SARP family transcriptional regulator [Actinomycetospora lemnae]|uniref:Bacterial transcriptional activator domain-containing protein n=1 Tax=Actinomycetospora lemnae TaxID=3019891 RepID=A0ABT5SS16_9PSEU|nr:hypothetical protein [Actinomycetospora sp. DW7H6]MDD7965496.1 hypothetical protein [Actinomycetospora sp. DW7H6]